MTASWLGIDIGTSALKALLISDDGVVLARSSVPYQDASTGPGALDEQDPAIWVDAAQAAVRECVREGGVPAGIGLTGQVPTLVLVDETGAVVRPAMTWRDARAVTEAEELERELGPSEPHIGMDLPWSPAHLPAKLRWLAAHEPEAVRRSRHVLQPKDYLGLLLTGSTLSDAWSVKGIGHIRTGLASKAVMDACGWDADVCPPTAEPWASRGATVGGTFGLPDGIDVSVGWSDALCSMLAVGAFDRPIAFILTGTSEIVGMSTARSTGEAPGLYRIPIDCAPRNVLYGPTQSSGGTAVWLARVFDVPVEALPDIAAGARGAVPPVFVPYISGERAPLWRPDVRAVLAGLDAEDGRPEIVRSVLNGISLSAADVLDIAAETAGETFDAIHIAGRGAADLAWKTIRLQTLGRPVLFHREPFVAALGAAMLGRAAATGGDLGSDLGSDLDRLRGAPTVCEPTPSDIDASTKALADYRSVSSFAQCWRTS